MPRTEKPQRRQRSAPRRQPKKRRWLRLLLFYLFFPIVVWFVAFLIWFNWPELSRLFPKAGEITKSPVKRENKAAPRQTLDKQKAEAVPEKILDEDRRKLEDILKQRQ